MVISLLMIGALAPAANAATHERVGNTVKWTKNGPLGKGTVAKQIIHARPSQPGKFDASSIVFTGPGKMQHRCSLLSITYRGPDGGKWQPLPDEYLGDVVCKPSQRKVTVNTHDLPKGFQVQVIDQQKWKKGVKKPKSVAFEASEGNSKAGEPVEIATGRYAHWDLLVG